MKKNTITGAFMKSLCVANAISSFKTFGNWIKMVLSFTFALHQEDTLIVLSALAGTIRVGSVLSTAQYSLSK
jgi:flagellar motor component MotA